MRDLVPQLWITSLVLCVCCACGDDSSDGDAGAGQPALRTLIEEEIALYDRRVIAVCPCLVAQGVYENEQECLDLALSGPDWVECATTALAGYDSAASREDSQCYIDFLEQTAECTEAAECEQDALAECGAPDAECLAMQSDRINVILAECPDFGLLSRVSE